MTAVIVAVLAVAVIGGLLALERRRALKEARKMSFRETMDLTNIPIVTFNVGGMKLNFIIDTGAADNYVASNVVDEGVVKLEKLPDKGGYFSVEGKSHDTDMVRICLEHHGETYDEVFGVGEFDECFRIVKAKYGVTLHGVLGSLFLERHKYMMDFADLKAYPK